jgi:hypothetical protein
VRDRRILIVLERVLPAPLEHNETLLQKAPVPLRKTPTLKPWSRQNPKPQPRNRKDKAHPVATGVLPEMMLGTMLPRRPRRRRPGLGDRKVYQESRSHLPGMRYTTNPTCEMMRATQRNYLHGKCGLQLALITITGRIVPLVSIPVPRTGAHQMEKPMINAGMEAILPRETNHPLIGGVLVAPLDSRKEVELRPRRWKVHGATTA